MYTAYIKPLEILPNQMISIVEADDWNLTHFDVDSILNNDRYSNKFPYEIQRNYTPILPLVLYTDDDLRSIAYAGPEPDEDF
jgi:hypothetical protein